MNHAVTAAALAAVLLVGGCASTDRCPEPGEYAAAQTVAPYTVPDGTDRPATNLRLRVPEPAGAVPAGLRGNRWEAADGSLRCLDQPPPMRSEVLPGN